MKLQFSLASALLSLLVITASGVSASPIEAKGAGAGGGTLYYPGTTYSDGSTGLGHLGEDVKNSIQDSADAAWKHAVNWAKEHPPGPSQARNSGKQF